MTMSKIKQKQLRRQSEIVEKALELMKTTPFEDIGIKDVCSAAGISVGTFYHYFTKKSDLLVGMFELIDVYLEDEVFPKLTSESEIENLTIYAHGFATHIYENGIERSKLVMSIQPSDTDMSGTLRPAKAKLIEIISRGQEKGQIITQYSAETLASYFLLAVRGVAADWSRYNNAYPIVEQMDQFIGLFIKALQTQEPPTDL